MNIKLRSGNFWDGACLAAACRASRRRRYRGRIAIPTLGLQA